MTAAPDPTKVSLACADGRHFMCYGKVYAWPYVKGRRFHICECPECTHGQLKPRLHPHRVRRNYVSSTEQREAFGNRCAICHATEPPDNNGRGLEALQDLWAWETYSCSLGLICGNCDRGIGYFRSRMDRHEVAATLRRGLAYLDGDHSRCICDNPIGRQRDHDHAKGAHRTKSNERGLLCPSCNSGLGEFENHPERLHRAIDVLTGPYIPTQPTGAMW